ncbi:transcription factor [Asimina triloba]
MTGSDLMSGIDRNTRLAACIFTSTMAPHLQWWATYALLLDHRNTSHGHPGGEIKIRRTHRIFQLPDPRLNVLHLIMWMGKDGIEVNKSSVVIRTTEAEFFTPSLRIENRSEEESQNRRFCCSESPKAERQRERERREGEREGERVRRSYSKLGFLSISTSGFGLTGWIAERGSSFSRATGSAFVSGYRNCGESRCKSSLQEVIFEGGAGTALARLLPADLDVGVVRFLRSGWGELVLDVGVSGKLGLGFLVFFGFQVFSFVNKGRIFGSEDGKQPVGVMPSFVSPLPASQSLGTEVSHINPSRVSSFGTLEQSLGFCVEDAVDLSRNPLFNSKSSGPIVSSVPSQFANFNKIIASPDITPAARVGYQRLPQEKAQQPNLVSLPSGHLENWGESTMADASPRTDTSTDVDTDDKNQRLEAGQSALVAASDSSDRSKDRAGDQKTLRRLAQNREAARKSRLRKKAYVQQLESSRLKLTQLEQELQRARQQELTKCKVCALAFDIEYARWLEEHNRQINELRAAVNSHAGDNELRIIVNNVMSHYDEIFRLKGIAAKADVFHMLSGMWKTPAERCFMWLGGFRSSELLKLLVSHLEPLTEQQLMGICNLQQSSQQAEDALSQGMEALQQSLAETLASGSLGPSGSSGNVANYMGQMAMAMGKLGTLEGFLHQEFHDAALEKVPSVTMASPASVVCLEQ